MTPSEELIRFVESAKVFHAHPSLKDFPAWVLFVWKTLQGRNVPIPTFSGSSLCEMSVCLHFEDIKDLALLLDENQKEVHNMERLRVWMKQSLQEILLIQGLSSVRLEKSEERLLSKLDCILCSLEKSLNDPEIWIRSSRF